MDSLSSVSSKINFCGEHGILVSGHCDCDPFFFGVLFVKIRGLIIHGLGLYG